MPDLNEKIFIEHILNAIQTIAAGDLSTVIELSGTFPELDAIAAGINMLAGEIRENDINVQERQNRLEKSKVQTETILRSIQTGIFIIDQKSHLIMDVNPMGEELIGLPKDLITGNKCHKFICPKEEGQCPISDLGMTVSNEEKVLITGKGDHVPVMKTVIGIDYQGRNSLLESVVDISKLKEKEKQLLESEERFELAVQGSSDGIWDWDIKRNELYISPQLKMQIGYEDHELKNEMATFWNNVHPEDRPRVLQAFRDYVEGKADRYQEEFRFRHKNSTYIWILARGVAIFDEQGKAIRLSGSHTDITLMKQAYDELAHLNATKNKFFNIIAHDLKNPLSTIIGFSDLLNKNSDEPQPDKQREYIQFIKQTSNEAFELLKNLLEWASLQTGRIQSKPVELSIENLIDMTIHLLRPSAEKKGITLESNCSESYKVWGDKNMILTVLRNLGINAIKFTGEKGKVIFRLEHWPDDGMIMLTVEDNGIGIKPKDILSLFRIDSKHSSTGTAGEKGTGLGLILCKEFVELNGGRIWAESEPGKWTKFHFTIPAVVPLPG